MWRRLQSPFSKRGKSEIILERETPNPCSVSLTTRDCDHLGDPSVLKFKNVEQECLELRRSAGKTYASDNTLASASDPKCLLVFALHLA